MNEGSTSPIDKPYSRGKPLTRKGHDILYHLDGKLTGEVDGVSTFLPVRPGDLRGGCVSLTNLRKIPNDVNHPPFLKEKGTLRVRLSWDIRTSVVPERLFTVPLPSYRLVGRGVVTIYISCISYIITCVCQVRSLPLSVLLC